VSVSAIVVNYNGRDHVVRCVDSLVATLATIAAPTELMVVDNGSVDGSCETLRAAHPGLRVFELGRNRGFAGAVAEGLRATSGKWVLLLNNDATIERGALELLVSAGETSPSVGAVAPTILFADGSDRINSAGLVVDRLGIAHDRLVGEPAAARGTHPVEVFGASGGGAMLRRSMLEDIGGIDESFFMYLEDVDMAWRARARGWRAVHVPDALVHHHHSMTAVHGSELKYFHVGRGRVRVLAKNAGTGQLVRYGAAMLAHDLAYVAYVAAADRTLAPLRGRLEGLAQWRSCRGRGGTQLDPAELAPMTGPLAALRRRRVWRTHSGARAAKRRRGSVRADPEVPAEREVLDVLPLDG
jgi:GT2 family glycosyltransferase